MRVVVLAVAIVQDRQGRTLLIDRHGRLVLPGGKMKDGRGRDIIRQFSTTRAENEFVRLFLADRRREPYWKAARRELIEEIGAEMVPPIVTLTTRLRSRVQVRRSHAAVSVLGTSSTGADTRYIVSACDVDIPRKWQLELWRAYRDGDRRVCWAQLDEIQNARSATHGLIRITVRKIFGNLGLVETTSPHPTDDRTHRPKLSLEAALGNSKGVANQPTAGEIDHSLLEAG